MPAPAVLNEAKPETITTTASTVESSDPPSPTAPSNQASGTKAIFQEPLPPHNGPAHEANPTQESSAQDLKGHALTSVPQNSLAQQPIHNHLVIETNVQDQQQHHHHHQQQTTSLNGGCEVSRETLDEALAKNSSESQERDSPATTSMDSINSNNAPLALSQHDQHANNMVLHTTTTTTQMHGTNNSPKGSVCQGDTNHPVNTIASTTGHIEPDELSPVEDIVEEHFSFYMNDAPSPSNQARARPLNSELAGDSDDDEDDNVKKSRPSNSLNSTTAAGVACAVGGNAAKTLETPISVATPPMSPSTSALPYYRPSSSLSSPDGSKASDIDTSRDMLTKGQAFAYVGLVLVTANTFFQALDSVPDSAESARAKESLESFISKLIYSLSRHMDIDADTQKTIAQLPQMMIHPEDLLETFVADGTSRVVSSSQVDQVSLTRPTSPAMSMTSNGSSSFASSSSSPKASHPSSSSILSAETLVEPMSTPLSPSVLELQPPALPLPPTDASLSQQPPSEAPRLSISSHTSTESSLSEVQRTSSANGGGGGGGGATNGDGGGSNGNSSNSISSAPSSMVRHSFASSRSASSLSTNSGGSGGGGKATRSIIVDLKWTLIADLFLIAIGDSVYDSRARVLLKTVGRHLGLEWDEIVQMEHAIMKQLQQSSSSSSQYTTTGSNNSGTAGNGSGADLLKVDTKSRNAETRKRRMIMMGLATVGGGLVLGLSAGLFAPVIGAGIGAALAGAHITGATATAASAFLAGSGGVAVITSGAAVTGSGLAMKKMARRTAGIDTFEFINVHDNNRANVILTISGWLDIGEEDATLPFSTLETSNGDHTALFWEPEMLMNLGSALGLLTSEILTLTAQEILKHTLLGGLLSALAWPMALTRLGYLIDNPWSNALDRAKLAGLVLADCLVMRSYLGFRPVTLVGYSLGARVIFYCLVELARLDAFGIVEDVFLFGAPVTASSTQWRQAQSVVAGDFVNGYLKNDWVLGFLFRATTGGLGTVAGLRPLQNVGDRIRNVDLTGDVDGHMDYRLKIPMLMRKVGHLAVSSESFLDKEEEVLFQRQQKRKNPSEPLRAPKPKMPSKAELENSLTLTDEEKKQLEAAFRRPAPKAQVPDVDAIQGLTDQERKQLKEALGIVD